MTLKRDPSKTLQIGFVVLLVISAGLAGYWIRENVLYARVVEQRIGAAYSRLSEDELRSLLGDLGPSAGGIREAVFADLVRERAARINRYLWEGGFFLVVLVSGMAVLTRTIRHDAELRRRQQNFLAAVSHEFKSPLASMRLAAETLLLRSDEAHSKQLAERILEDDERLLRMVDNLLDTNRLEEGRRTLSPEQASLHEVVQASIAEVGARAQSNDIELIAEVPESVILWVDRAALETILRNLLDNAIKACKADDGHAITVKTEQHDGRLMLSVSDDGLGFSPEDAALMFEKFHRLGDELRRPTPGTGLGLYIVKRLAGLSGARVSATSAGPGRGATITISWPSEMWVSKE